MSSMTFDTVPKKGNAKDKKLFDEYLTEDFYDEVVDGTGSIREDYTDVASQLKLIGANRLDKYQTLKDRLFRSRDVTFNVYGNSSGLDRTWPLDLIPRIINADTWETIEKGLAQRLQAMNLFLGDIYTGDSSIAKEGVIPADFITNTSGYSPLAVDLPQPMNARALVAGIDLVRDDKGSYLVLEDNLRTPSGVSYVLENRSAMTQLLPTLVESANLRPVEQYPVLLLRALQSIAPPSTTGVPTVVLLTPGVYNSAYFEHAFLAQNMGIELVEGRDLFVDEGFVWMKTTRGKKKVDVIYRRIDDEYLDPKVGNPDSVLGVHGLIDVVRNQKVSIANALGNGAADNKAMYTYVPDMIRYYLNEEPILPNVPTYLLSDTDKREEILKDPTKYVIKTVDGSGGYDIFIGSQANGEQTEKIRKNVRTAPHRYVAQEIVKLSRHPSMVDGRLEPRHIDLRPFVVGGECIDVLPGGLTRVALKKGSLIVNSSQGGGSKDTWILQKPDATYTDKEQSSQYKGETRSDKILARAAAPLFWAGRYLERVEATARLLASSYNEVLSSLPGEAQLRWSELLEVLALSGEYSEKQTELSSYAVTRFLLDDTENKGSIISSLTSARDNLRMTREKVPAELREVVNDTWAAFAITDFEKELNEQPQLMFEKLIRAIQTCQGITESSMSRNDTWRFLTIGKVTERALLTTRLVEVHFTRLLDTKSYPSVPHCAGLLRTAGAVFEYRKIFQTSVDPLDAIEFLLRNKEFSRSLYWCIRQLEAQLVAMEAGAANKSLALIECQRIKLAIESPLKNLLGDTPSFALNNLANDIEKLSDRIHTDYFPEQ